MYKSRNKLHGTIKKWVVTIFATAAIGVSGYTILSTNVIYAKKIDPANDAFFFKVHNESAREAKINNEKDYKASQEFYKTLDKGVGYSIDGNIPKDKTNIDVAKQYKKELPQMEKQLNVLQKGTKKYKVLSHEIKMHKMVIKEVLEK